MVCVECLPADKSWDCGVCDTPELWRGAAGLCARVRACAGAAESVHAYTYIRGCIRYEVAQGIARESEACLGGWMEDERSYRELLGEAHAKMREEPRGGGEGRGSCSTILIPYIFMLVDVCGGCGSPGGGWPCVPVPPCGIVRALAFSPLTRLDYSDVDDTFAFWLTLARS